MYAIRSYYARRRRPARAASHLHVEVLGSGLARLRPQGLPGSHAGLAAEITANEIQQLLAAGPLTDPIGNVGAIKAGSLNSDTAFVNISGLGSATLRVNDLLDVNISGGGSVRYYGDPSVDSRITSYNVCYTKLLRDR